MHECTIFSLISEIIFQLSAYIQHNHLFIRVGETNVRMSYRIHGYSFLFHPSPSPGTITNFPFRTYHIRNCHVELDHRTKKTAHDARYVTCPVRVHGTRRLLKNRWQTSRRRGASHPEVRRNLRSAMSFFTLSSWQPGNGYHHRRLGSLARGQHKLYTKDFLKSRRGYTVLRVR